MWVSIPTVILLALFAAQDVAQSAAATTTATPVATTDQQGRKQAEKPAISLEYKPIRPSYQSSGSNVAQIIPPGEPWPASAAGYANFSQLSPAAVSKLELANDVPLLQSAPTPSNMINLNMSNPKTNFTEALVKVLAPSLSNVKTTGTPQTIPVSLNITPPPNANMDFIQSLQTAVRAAISSLVPSAGTSIRIAITKSSTGAIVNVKAYLDVIVPAAGVKVTPTLPPSTVPEINLSKGTSGLTQSLQSILLKELLEAGYNPESQSVQNFSLSFSVIPPEGATKDYVKLNILGPLQMVLKRIAPRAALTAVTVQTQESNNKILRQTVKFSIQVKPPVKFKMNEKLIEVPEVSLNKPGTNLVNTVVTTLQNDIMKIAAVDPTNAKTLSIPFKVSPPAGATEQGVQEMYILPLSEVLSKLDPTGKVLKISQKTLPNGDIVIVIYMNVPAISNNGQGQTVASIVVPQTTVANNEESEQSTLPSTIVPISINNRNAFPEEDELPEVPPEVTETPETNETTVPNNAVRTSTIDLTTPTASVKSIEKVLNDELSPLSNPVNDDSTKVLAIPFKMKPPAGATLQQIEQNVVVPIGKLLATLEPTGDVLTSQTKSLPNGDVESVVYFNIPSVVNSKTYQDLAQRIQFPGSSTQPSATSEASISPATKTPLNQTPGPKTSKNSREMPPIDLSHPNFDVLKNGIEERLQDAIKSNPNGNNKPQTVSFPFVVPKDQAKRIPITAQAIATLLKGLVPSGKAVPDISPKVLPNGDVEFTIFYEIPSGNVGEQTMPSSQKPSQESHGSTTPKSARVMNTTSMEMNEQESTTAETSIQTEPQPYNAILISPTNNMETLSDDIPKILHEVNGIKNDKPEIIGIPFQVNKNQPFFSKTSLRTLLSMVLPGNLLPETQTIKLPNGNEQYTVYFEKPAVSTNKPTGGSTTTEKSGQTQPQPYNAVLISPIDVLNDLDNLDDDVPKILHEISGIKNDQPQVVGIPFLLKKNPSTISQFVLRKMLETVLPGTLLPETQTTKLPDGNEQYTIYFEKPAVSTNKSIGGSTTTETSSQTEPEPYNAVLISPIDVSNGFDNLKDVILKVHHEVSGIKNDQPQVIGIPFVVNNNQPYFSKIALRTLLNMVLPGNLLPETQTIKLPDGNEQYTVYFKKPAVSTNEPTEQVVEESTTLEASCQTESQPYNAVLISPTVVTDKMETLKDDILKIQHEFNGFENDQTEIIGIPFQMQNNPSYFLTTALRQILKMVLPGDLLPETQTIQLPNGDVQYTIYFEKPAVSTNKPTGGSTTTEKSSQTEPQPYKAVLTSPINITNDIHNLQEDIPKILDEVSGIENDQPQVIGIPFLMEKNPSTVLKFVLRDMLESELPGKLLPETQTKKLPNGNEQFTIYFEKPAVSTNIPTEQNLGESTTPETSSQTEPQPYNAVLTNPIDINSLNFETIKSGIETRIAEVGGIKNAKPELVGIPFDMKEDDFSYLLTEALRNYLELIVPGEVLPETHIRKLPNGGVQYILYFKKPAVATIKPVGRVVERQTKPPVENRNTETTSAETPIVTPTLNLPKNTVLIPPINIQKFDMGTIKNQLDKNIADVSESHNGQPQIVGIPVNLPNNQKSRILEFGFKTVLDTLLPGEVLPEPQTRVLPNGETQLIFLYKPPGTQTEQVVGGSTTTETSSQTEPQPYNAVLTKPIVINSSNLETIKSDIEKSIAEVSGIKNAKPEIIGIPFDMKNRGFSYLLTEVLRNYLELILPGEVLPETHTRNLPNGGVQYILYYKKPAVATIKPVGRVVERQTKPPVENRNTETTSAETPIVTPTLNLPKNTVLIPPINIQKFDMGTIKNQLDKNIADVSESHNGQPQIVGIPVNLPNNQKSRILEFGFKTVLDTLLPGEVLPEPQTRVLPNGETQLIFLYKPPGTQTSTATPLIQPAQAVEDVNLDGVGATVPGEVGKALVEAISTISSNPESLNKPADIKFNIYAPLGNNVTQNQGIINSVSSELQKLEPSAKIVAAKVNQKPQSNEPDGLVEITIPSVASSKTAQNIKNAVEIPTIDINVPEMDLVVNIQKMLQRGLKTAGNLNPQGSQLFDLSFRLNPFDTKGSVAEILKALKAVDPSGQVVSYKISSRPDGLDYLDVVYLIPMLKDSLVYEKVKPKQPEVVYESVVNIDTRNPMSGLLEKVISEIGAAEDEVKGAKEEQLVDLPLDFKFTNSKGLPGSQVSDVIRRTLPYIEGFISQVLPEGKVLSVNTVILPNSDDVILKIVVRTPYEPDNTIVIEEQRPSVVVVTTPKPKSKGLFGFFGL